MELRGCVSQHRIKRRGGAGSAARHHSALGEPAKKDSVEPSTVQRPVQQLYTNEEIARLRYWFLALLAHYTTFFASLHSDVWQSRDPAALDGWKAAQSRITVEGWLLEAVEDTLAYWTEHPGSPQAALAPGYRHFYWRGSSVWLQPFAPVFTDPLPRISQPPNFMETTMATPLSELGKLTGISREPPDQFKARMRDQFDKQLSEYARTYKRAVFDTEWVANHPKLVDYMTWLMYRLVEVPLERIVQEFPGVSHYEYPKETVKHRVADLANAMGIQVADWK